MTPNLETACLRYNITHPEPGRVEQSLSVYPDGRRELYVTAALAPEMRNQAGVFTAEADDATGLQAQELARRLAALDFAGRPYPRGVQWSVTAQDGGGSRSHLLSVTDQTPLPTDLQEALVFGKGWMDQAASSPYQAVAMNASLKHTARGPRLSVFFHSAGAQPVGILLIEGGLALDAAARDGARREIWRLTGRSVMGMLYPDGSLADGVNIPAGLTAGGQALLALRPDLPDLADADQPLILRCRAWMDAAPPGEPARSFTDVPVWLACPVDIG